MDLLYLRPFKKTGLSISAVTLKCVVDSISFRYGTGASLTTAAPP
jgi:hypothetical protein